MNQSFEAASNITQFWYHSRRQNKNQFSKNKTFDFSKSAKIRQYGFSAISHTRKFKYKSINNVRYCFHSAIMDTTNYYDNEYLKFRANIDKLTDLIEGNLIWKTFMKHFSISLNI